MEFIHIAMFEDTPEVVGCPTILFMEAKSMIFEHARSRANLSGELVFHTHSDGFLSNLAIAPRHCVQGGVLRFSK